MEARDETTECFWCEVETGNPADSRGATFCSHECAKAFAAYEDEIAEMREEDARRESDT